MIDRQKEYVARLRRVNAALRLLNNQPALATRIYRQLDREGFVTEVVERRFDSQGATSGTPWAPLKPATVKQRLYQGFNPGPILIRSGTLFKAARDGQRTYSETGIKLKLKDGPAPRYIGKGRARRTKKLGTLRVSNLDTGGIVFTRTKKLSDYADALNKARPFYAPPTNQELAPMRARGMQILAEFYRRALTGQSFSGLF